MENAIDWVKSAKRLPAWAEPHPTDPRAVLVDPDKAYPEILTELKRFGADPTKPNKYFVEIAYQFIKMDLQVALQRFNFTIHIRSDGDRKQRWNLSMLPGDDAEIVQATKGREAREHYKAIRGFIPS